MRRRPKPHSVSLPPVRLYLEDIEEAIGIIRDAFEHPVTITITTEDFILDRATELENLGKKALNRLVVECEEPHIRLSFEPDKAEIISEDDTPLIIGTIAKLEHHLLRRKRIARNSVKNVLPLSSLLVSYGLLMVLIVYLSDGLYSAVALTAAGFALCVFLFAVSARFSRYTYSTIILRSRHEQQSFWTTPRGISGSKRSGIRIR